MIYKAKKSLGQNFLKSELALRQIVDAGEIKKGDVILEIGPGKGALTEKLLNHAELVIAIEKDYELFEFLKEKFNEQIKSGALVLVHGDILEFDIRKFVRQDLTNYKIIANIPYNITGAILKKFLIEKNQPEMMVLMVQHEVAQRILARDGKESLLSISVKAYGEPKMVAKVDKRYFSPAPKVNSAIISIKNISRKNFNSPLEEYSDPKSEGGGSLSPAPLHLYPNGEGKERGEDASTPSRKRATPQEGNLEERFWEIVKAGFAHKRKKLSGNLRGVCKEDILAPYADKRAEDLTLSDWMMLASKK